MEVSPLNINNTYEHFKKDPHFEIKPLGSGTSSSSKRQNNRVLISTKPATNKSKNKSPAKSSENTTPNIREKPMLPAVTRFESRNVHIVSLPPEKAETHNVRSFNSSNTNLNHNLKPSSAGFHVALQSNLRSF